MQIEAEVTFKCGHKETHQLAGNVTQEAIERFTKTVNYAKWCARDMSCKACFAHPQKLRIP